MPSHAQTGARQTIQIQGRQRRDHETLRITDCFLNVEMQIVYHRDLFVILLPVYVVMFHIAVKEMVVQLIMTNVSVEQQNAMTLHDYIVMKLVIPVLLDHLAATPIII